MVDSAAILENNIPADNPTAQEQEVFVPVPNSARFFKNRGRRSIDYYRELQEYRRREGSGDRNYDQERRAYEQYLEDDRSERYERMRQYYWRALHHGGYSGYGYGYYPHGYYYYY